MTAAWQSALRPGYRAYTLSPAAGGAVGLALLPVIGAVAEGTINLLSIHHFQEMARGHFAVKRLDKQYGGEAVRTAYERPAI